MTKFAPARIDLEKFFVGFDNFLNNPLYTQQLPDYPRYNIEKVEGGYQIQVAVPGWKRDQIEISVHNDVLKITGAKKEETVERNWVHKGISGKSFTKQLKLDNTLRVADASLEDGMLNIDLVYCENAQPKLIEIK